MVSNNTHRPLDADEFRGFTLADSLAPLIFINTRQTGNAQLFTIAHEMAHVWRASTGVSREDPNSGEESAIEWWCNQVAAEFLVPRQELVDHFPAVAGMDLVGQLKELARTFRCGTLVVLQALRRHGLRDFADFDVTYGEELDRLVKLVDEGRSSKGGGDYWLNQRYRIGARLATAITNDAAAGRTETGDAVHLTGLGSLDKFQELSRRLGVR